MTLAPFEISVPGAGDFDVNPGEIMRSVRFRGIGANETHLFQVETMALDPEAASNPPW